MILLSAGDLIWVEKRENGNYFEENEELEIK
jgi:hypothetical protein